jgi:hypothetical protein
VSAGLALFNQADRGKETEAGGRRQGEGIRNTEYRIQETGDHALRIIDSCILSPVWGRRQGNLGAIDFRDVHEKDIDFENESWRVKPRCMKKSIAVILFTLVSLVNLSIAMVAIDHHRGRTAVTTTDPTLQFRCR